jgi:hypothetical protein
MYRGESFGTQRAQEKRTLHSSIAGTRLLRDPIIIHESPVCAMSACGQGWTACVSITWVDYQLWSMAELRSRVVPQLNQKVV